MQTREKQTARGFLWSTTIWTRSQRTTACWGANMAAASPAPPFSPQSGRQHKGGTFILTPRSQISFKPGFGAYQSLAQKIKVPFPGFSPSFCSFEGSRAISKPAPNPGTHQTPVETLSECATLGSGNAEGSRNPWVIKFHGTLGCWFISLWFRGHS